MKILITGTTHGIGKSIAQKFLDEGHSVYGIDVCPASLTHPNYTHVLADVSIGELPQIDGVQILINNAGVQNSGKDIDVNLKGAMRVTERYAMQPQIKSVLFIASASAHTGSEFPEYAASKGGLISYMKNVALRLARWNATSNSLSPGGVLTHSNERVIKDKKLWQRIMDQTLIQKWAETSEIADWAYFVTVINKSMTAQDILIDNGEIAKAEFVW